jgi:hypothetical protein
MAVTQAIGIRLGILRSWLLAPIAGQAVTVICVMVVNQAGIPVREFALPLAAALLAASSVVIWWRPPMVPLKRLWPFWVVLGFAAVYIGWQTVAYGFNWTGYGNADALAYCQSASRVMDHGFFDIPKLADLLGRDYTQASWFQFGPGLYRCGFDLVLAWAASLARMNPFAIYMPLMLCLGMVQISAIAALVLLRSRLWKHALLASAFLAMSPLFGFSVIAQVGPQVGGLALMLGLCALTLRSGGGGWRNAVRLGIMIALVSVGLTVFYPETLPFWGLSYLGFQAALVPARRANVGFQLCVLATAAAVAGVVGRANLLRGYLSVAIAIQASKPVASGVATVFTGFETFKMPHGAAVLFGVSDGQRLLDPPWLSMVIVLGFVLLGICIWRAVRDACRLQPYAFVSLAMAAVTALLFRSPNAFGLFKMGLYIQPLVMAAAAAAAKRLPRTGIGALLAFYLLVSFVPHYWAVTASTGALPGLSSAGVNLPTGAGGAVLETDTSTTVQESLLQVYLKGAPLETLNARGSVVPQAAWVSAFVKPLLGKHVPYPHEVAESDALAAQLGESYEWEERLGFRFKAPFHPFAGRHQLITLGSVSAYFNQLSTFRKDRYFSYPDDASVRNLLVFINTVEGHDFYESSVKASYYPFEKDFFRPGKRFYGIGRYFLFEVRNPAVPLRIRVSLSRTQVGDGRTGLPRGAIVLADQDSNLGLVGAGAANIFSPPIRPVSVKGHHFIAIDFGDELIAPPNRKQGLMRLYNEEIPIDTRLLVGYGRDISAISEEDYSRIERPQRVSKWPEDLFRGAGVEFSGFYEDGWVSDHAMMKLGSSRTGEHLVIRGMVPGIGALAKGTLLRIRINGKLVATESLRPGRFEVDVPALEDRGVTGVNLEFGLQEKLPNRDDRPVSARIDMIGIE